MTGMDRTMYKLLVVALACMTIVAAFSMYFQISIIFNSGRTGFGYLYYPRVFSAAGQFLLSLTALYWVPKIIKKFFPEVS